MKVLSTILIYDRTMRSKKMDEKILKTNKKIDLQEKFKHFFGNPTQ